MKARQKSLRTISQNHELADYLNKSNLPAAMLAAYFEENRDKHHLLQMVQQHFADNQVTIRHQTIQPENVRLIGGENNINFLIETADKRISMVIQLGVRPYAVNEACRVLGRRQVWLAEQYGEQRWYTGKSERINDGSRCNREINLFMTGDYGYFLMMERCKGSLTEKVAALHATKASPNERIAFAQKIMKQLVDVLSIVSKNDIIWTDLKPGNILLRGDQDQVVISDMKAFRLVSQVLVRSNLNDGLMFQETTAAYLSEGMIDAMKLETMKEQMKEHKLILESVKKLWKKLWEMEYSYQLGTLLYFIMTGKEHLAPLVPGEKYSLFSFDDPVFEASEEEKKCKEEGAGKRIQSIIELLTAPDMNRRFSFAKAWDLLKLVLDEHKFNGMKIILIEEIKYKPGKPSIIQPRDIRQERCKSQTIRSASGTIFAKNVSPRGVSKNHSDNLMEVGSAIPASPESPKSPGRRFSRRFP